MRIVFVTVVALTLMSLDVVVMAAPTSAISISACPKLPIPVSPPLVFEIALPDRDLLRRLRQSMSESADKPSKDKHKTKKGDGLRRANQPWEW